MTVVLSTTNCMEAYDKKEGGWAIGSYHYLTTNIEIDVDENTIAWSEDSWGLEKSYFQEYLNNEIGLYEKRYKTEVTHIALAGNLGLWNGSPPGGRLIPASLNPLEFMGDVDDIEVSIDPDSKIITILGHHHDGTHRMNLYLLSPNKKEKYFYDTGTPEEFERIIEEGTPLKHSKSGEGYFNVAKGAKQGK